MSARLTATKRTSELTRLDGRTAWGRTFLLYADTTGLDVPIVRISVFDIVLRLGYTCTVEEFVLTLGSKIIKVRK